MHQYEQQKHEARFVHVDKYVLVLLNLTGRDVMFDHVVGASLLRRTGPPQDTLLLRKEAISAGSPLKSFEKLSLSSKTLIDKDSRDYSLTEM
jgi:hypothetical protein